MERLWEINLGATAIGTGIAADPATPMRFASISPESPATTSSLRPNLVEATTDVGVFMELSGALKRSAMKLSKICNDLRLLCSGPAGGVSAKSTCRRDRRDRASCRARSNPVIPEVVNEVAFVVAGADVTLTHGRRGGSAAAQRLRARSWRTCCSRTSSG